MLDLTLYAFPILVNIIKIDITTESEIVKLKKFIIKKFRKIDILINNASIDHVPSKKNVKFKNLTLKSWNKEIGVDVMC